MSHSPAPQATAHACLRAALRADAAPARARLGAGLAALILTLLLRLLARTEAAWDIIPETTDDREHPHARAAAPALRAPPVLGSVLRRNHPLARGRRFTPIILQKNEVQGLGPWRVWAEPSSLIASNSSHPCPI
jgi:hypothetical protein